MPDSVEQQSTGGLVYTAAGSFLGAAAGGGWFGIVLLSLAGFYEGAAPWQNLLAGTVAGVL